FRHAEPLGDRKIARRWPLSEAFDLLAQEIRIGHQIRPELEHERVVVYDLIERGRKTANLIVDTALIADALDPGLRATTELEPRDSDWPPDKWIERRCGPSEIDRAARMLRATERDDARHALLEKLAIPRETGHDNGCGRGHDGVPSFKIRRI